MGKYLGDINVRDITYDMNQLEKSKYKVLKVHEPLKQEVLECTERRE